MAVMNNQQSILSCLKKGGGVDVRRALEYFSSLDSDKDKQLDEHHPRLVRTPSSSLLAVLSTPSSLVDPQWLFSWSRIYGNESWDRVNSFLNSVVESDEPKKKKTLNERDMLLILMEEDGTRRKATPRDTGWYFCMFFIQWFIARSFSASSETAFGAFSQGEMVSMMGKWNAIAHWSWWC